jgi:alpha-tubulin suppressor-like RCC1 family protein
MKIRRNLFPVGLLCAALLLALTSGAQPVTQIAAGGWHSLFLKSDGSLWAMGYNMSGQLGDGTYTNAPNSGTNFPEKIVTGGVTAIAAGSEHSLFLKSDGSLWAMGGNYVGELGDGTFATIFPFGTNRPEQIVASNVQAITAGSYHSLFLKTDGSLWGMGDNQFGELGNGTFMKSEPYGKALPEQIVASNVTAIAGGGYHSLVLKSDGSLWATGRNFGGELGDGTYSSTNRPEQIVASNVTAIAAGDGHSLFLKSDGSLWGMGDNSSGQLGDGTFSNANRPELIVASNVTAIAAGGWHSLFLKSDGSLWAMGYNQDGKLGDGTYSNAYAPEMIVSTVVKAIAAGVDHSLFLKSDGSLWGMGYNGYGQLGAGNFMDTNRPVQILGPYNQIQTTGQFVGDTNMQMSFVGIANTNYALDRAFSLSPLIDWIPQATNPASSYGPLVFTNAPDPATNNFWRVRSVP